MSIVIVTTDSCTEPHWHLCSLSTMESTFATSLHHCGSAGPMRLHLHSPQYLQDSWILILNLPVHVSVDSSNLSVVIFHDCHSCSHLKRLLCLDCLRGFFAQPKIFTGYLITQWQWFDYLLGNNDMMPVFINVYFGWPIELLNGLSSNSEPGIVNQKAIFFKHPADQTEKKICDRKKIYFNIKAEL